MTMKGPGPEGEILELLTAKERELNQCQLVPAKFPNELLRLTTSKSISASNNPSRTAEQSSVKEQETVTLHDVNVVTVKARVCFAVPPVWIVQLPLCIFEHSKAQYLPRHEFFWQFISRCKLWRHLRVSRRRSS